MKNLLFSGAFALLALFTLSACESERQVTTTTTTEESVVHPAVTETTRTTAY